MKVKLNRKELVHLAAACELHKLIRMESPLVDAAMHDEIQKLSKYLEPRLQKAKATITITPSQIMLLASILPHVGGGTEIIVREFVINPFRKQLENTVNHVAKY